jgi:WD40 repeat protein/serine/threonine protein kinase
MGNRKDLATARDEKVRPAMSDQDWQKVEQLLHEALTLAEEQRAAFLDEACGPDEGLRAELESLLLVGDEMSVDYLKSPLSGELARDLERLRPSSTLCAGQLFAQRYELIRTLGEGGMGQVWLAAQTSPVRRQVALKLIKAGMYDEAVVQRFKSEAQSLAIMDHPAIARVFDAGTTAQGQPYLVMEYVPGLPITDYCDQQKLSIKDRLELFVRACDGVQHAHQKAIIHRDLKPSNILVIEVDGKPMPRLIDFGLAKTTLPNAAGENAFTQLGQFLGTPGYMSPEQVNLDAQDIDTRTDVYSLGVVLYVLLTGLQPFETKRREKRSLEEWLRQLREEEPANPSTKVSGDKDTSSATAEARGTDAKQLAGLLRGDLDWVTMKALERDRERRYGAPSELAADLKRFLSHEPVLARPASAGYQLRKFVRRHRIAAAFLGVTTALTIISSAAAFVALYQKHAAEFQATQTLQAQSRLLIQAAAERLNHSDVAGAQGIILAVLTNREFVQAHTPAAINVFQEIRAADALLAVLSGHTDIVYFAAYSPDGTRVVTASRDHTARIWDARTGAQLAVLSGHTDIVYCAVYSPDGTRVVTASRDHTARIWDAYSGAQLAVLSGHDDGVNSVSYSPNGMRIVTASFDKSARIWDARTGAQLAMLSGHRARLYSGAYSPDGTRIVTASWDKTIRIWDARTAAQLLVLSGHDDRVYSAVYSPDGTRIVSASWDKTARIWDARTGAQLASLSGHGDAVASAVYSPDASRIVTASWDKTARVWDARTGAQLAVLSGHGDIVYSAAYSPKGGRILTASWDKTARIWDTSTRAQVAILHAHDRLYTAAYSPDGLRVVTASEDKTAGIWDARTGVWLGELSGHEDRVFSAAYSPNGTRIVTASNDRTARVWDTFTRAQLGVFLGHNDSVDSVAYSPDGTRIVTASFDKSARIWDARTGAQLTVLSGHADLVYTAAYSPDGSHIVTASRDKTARIWDARTGTELTMLSGHGGYVNSALYSPDGRSIVTGSYDKTARIWDAGTGAQLAVLSGHGDIVFSAAYSRDGSRIVTASRDKSARIWDARTGAQLTVLLGHRDALASAAYSPDSRRIVTASADNTARVWDARVPADIAAQIGWDAAAEVDPLPKVDRNQLGLPPDSRIRTWDTRGSACDLAAAAIYDPARLTAGLLPEQITIGRAKEACSAETFNPGHEPRLDYELGRALLAKGDVNGARRQFELAMANGYHAARVDLADLLLEISTEVLDPGRALSLYEKAWQEGVPIAAFRMGRLYEFGSPASIAPGKRVALHPDAFKAWLWYQKGADAGEPNALARFAERDERSALAEVDTPKRHVLLLQAFSRYAAAAGRAYNEDWPDDAWKYWRYRRASLARVLAGEGMMQQVADAYGKVLEQGLPGRTLWERIKRKMHL